MRVLFSYGYCGNGGVETAVLSRCDALRRLGVETTVHFREFYGDGGRGYAALPHVRVGLNQIETAQLLRQQYDVIDIIDQPELLPAVRQYAPHATLLLETHAANPTRLREFYRTADDPAVAAMIVPTQFNGARVLESAMAHQKIQVVPNGIDTTVFSRQSAARVKHYFERLGMIQLLSAKVVLWVGRLEDEKDPRGFIRLAQDLARNWSDVHFICIGDAPHDLTVQPALARELGATLYGRFTFVRTVPNHEMPLYYSLAASTGGCLVSTSRAESAPMTFLEAMACECPIASTSVGGVTELLTSGANAELFDVGDRWGGMEAVLRLISQHNEQHRAQVVRRALTTVRSQHSLEVVGERWHKLLTALAPSRHIEPAVIEPVVRHAARAV